MKTRPTSLRLMGSAFELLAAHPDPVRSQELIEMGIAEIRRLEEKLSEFLPDSITSILNREAGIRPVRVDAEFFGLLERCLALARLSRGCFDPTVRPLKSLYSFKNQAFEMPGMELIRITKEGVGFEKIRLDQEKQTVFFTHPKLQISFSAIGKGYASDRVKHLWKKEGLESGYINASGDLNAFGSSPDGNPWKVGIANPDRPSSVLLHIPIHDASAATSGDYEQFFLWQNRRYSHNIDPRTGLPLSGIKSVTVFSPGAELSDALATAVYVMGTDEGISFVNQLPKTHCIIVDENNRIHFSKGLMYEEIPA